MSQKAVDLLLDYEKSLEKLYLTCAKKFPEHEAFWKKLSGEENRHAEIIKTLLEKVDGKSLVLNENRFKVSPLKSSLDYVEQVTGQVEAGKANLLKALAIADSIENSILEARYYEMFEANDPRLVQYLKQLRDETAGHRNRLRNKLAQVRRDSNLQPGS